MKRFSLHLQNEKNYSYCNITIVYNTHFDFVVIVIFQGIVSPPEKCLQYKKVLVQKLLSQKKMLVPFPCVYDVLQ